MLFLLTALGCAPKTPTTSMADTTAPLSSASLRADVELLASDEYRGRDTLDRGGGMAAAWLSEQLDQAGLTPLPQHAGLKVPFTLYERGFNPDQTTLSIQTGETTTTWTLGDG